MGLNLLTWPIVVEGELAVDCPVVGCDGRAFKLPSSSAADDDADGAIDVSSLGKVSASTTVSGNLGSESCASALPLGSNSVPTQKTNKTRFWSIAAIIQRTPLIAFIRNNSDALPLPLRASDVNLPTHGLDRDRSLQLTRINSRADQANLASG